jgi:gamma-glutamyl-gamma-aminobutyraldehyde dehydrogenase
MTSLAHFEVMAGALALPHEAVIDGRPQPSLSGRTFDNVTPCNGSVINRVAECGAGDVEAAASSSARAFEDGRWRSLHYRDRSLHALHKYADLKSVSITLR